MHRLRRAQHGLGSSVNRTALYLAAHSLTSKGHLKSILLKEIHNLIEILELEESRGLTYSVSHFLEDFSYQTPQMVD